MRRPTERELVHQRLGDRFATALSTCDTQRRVEVLTGDLLSDAMVRGKDALDAGCGPGCSGERLQQRGANLSILGRKDGDGRR